MSGYVLISSQQHSCVLQRSKQLCYSSVSAWSMSFLVTVLNFEVGAVYSFTAQTNHCGFHLLLELMVLFRTKRFLSLWRVNLWASNLQEKILIQKSHVLHIFVWLCSTPVGPHPHFSFPQNDLLISSTRLSWKQFSTWYIVCVSLLWLFWWHRLDTCYELGNGKRYAECTVLDRSHHT